MAPCLSGAVPGNTWCSTKSSASQASAWSRFLLPNTSRAKVTTVSLFCSGVGMHVSSLSGAGGYRGPRWQEAGGHVGGNGGYDGGRDLMGGLHGIGHAVGAGGLGAPLREERASLVEQRPGGFAPGNHVAQHVVHLETEPRRAAIMRRPGREGGERGRQRAQRPGHHVDRCAGED